MYGRALLAITKHLRASGYSPLTPNLPSYVPVVNIPAASLPGVSMQSVRGFLTAHQHKIGHPVPCAVSESLVKPIWLLAVIALMVTH